MRKRWMGWLICSAMTAALLAGCKAPGVKEEAKTGQTNVSETKAETESSQKEIPLIHVGFSGGEVEEQALKYAIEGAEEKFGCKIEIARYTDLMTLNTQLPAQVEAGTAPDLVLTTNEQYLEFVRNGIFIDLSPYITDEDYDFSRVTEQHKCWLIDGGIYGIPQDGGPACFIVNKDMWDAAGLGELPTTWDEVAEAAEKLTTDSVKGLCVNINETFHPTQYALSFGGGWGAGDTVVTEENAAGLQYIIDMYKKGYVITPTETGLGWDGEVFGKKLAAMSTGGMWYVATLQELAPDMNYEIIPVPDGGAKAFTGHSDATAVTKSSKYPEIAAKIAAYMGRDEAQQEIARLYGNPPAFKDLQDAFFDENPKLANLKDAMSYAQPFNYPPETAKFSDAMIAALQEALFTDSGMTGMDILEKVSEAMEK